MLANSHNEKYFARMSQSLGDKVRILKNLAGKTVLDVGAGGGELANAMSEFGYKVSAIDGSPAACERMRAEFPHLTVKESLVADLLNHFDAGTFDNIVCSSILHEVYSYEPGDQSAKISAVLEAFTIFQKLLAPGGRLIIRDGVKPPHWQKTVEWKLTGDHAQDFTNYFNEHSPFKVERKDCSFESVENSIAIQELGGNMFRSDLGSAMEFLYTYTWGMESAPREVAEFYGIMTDEEYVRAVENSGFVVDSHDSYLQNGYCMFLEATISDDLPNSNMLIVAHKQ